MSSIRPIAICVFLHEEKILVAEHQSANGIFYRPLGGGIEFGEHSTDALVREIQEEIGAALTLLEFLGTIENIFTFEEKQHHEIVFVYDAKFVDPGFYNKESHIREAPMIKVVWKPLSFFIQKQAPLYPEGLLELLMK
jgi:8-oxo-dGTP pyrophosphatase MutT (NUDIX family)